MTRAKALCVLICVLFLAGCGSHHRSPPENHPSAPVPGHPCQPSDYYMQCAIQRGGLGFLAPPPALRAFSYGIDFGWSSISGSYARSLGARFGASYLSPDGSKNWTRLSVARYHAQGLRTVAVWESSAGRALGGYYAGRSDASSARSQVAYLGEPRTRPIYFAVDFDTSGCPSCIVPYLQGVHDVLGKARSGVYGGYPTVHVALSRGLVRYAWQTSAWSRGRWDTRAQLEQYAYTNAYDWDRAVASDYGQWPYSRPAAPIPFTYWQACSALDAITYWRHHYGHVSPIQHDHAVAIRHRLRRSGIGCARPGWMLRPRQGFVSYPFRGARRPGALAQP